MSKCQCSKDFPEEPFAMLSGKSGRKKNDSDWVDTDGEQSGPKAAQEKYERESARNLHSRKTTMEPEN